MRSMGDPLYIYRPWPEERRARAREASLRRLGTPPGHRIIYGVPVPETLYDEVRDVAVRFRHRQKDVCEPLWKVRALILILMAVLKEGRP
jgi:hypothetical protein